jgi:hypothetical protein
MSFAFSLFLGRSLETQEFCHCVVCLLCEVYFGRTEAGGALYFPKKTLPFNHAEEKFYPGPTFTFATRICSVKIGCCSNVLLISLAAEGI